jgi:M3 family oligoendopeptidase
MLIDPPKGLSEVAVPSDAELARRYEEISAAVLPTERVEPLRDAFTRWDNLRRTCESWASLTRLRYAQDTRSDGAREELRNLDARTPRISALDKAMKQRFLGEGIRATLEGEIGAQAFALWRSDVSAFDDAISADLVHEADLCRSYTGLLASATVSFAGEERTLSGLAPYLQDGEREVRHAAERARWSIFSANELQLDELFDELVRVRDRMARTLGFASFTELGYRRMQRIDFDEKDVARYRDEVSAVVVPFAHELVRRYGAAKGLDRAFLWDESSLGVAGSIRPFGNSAWALAQTREALRAIDPELGDFASSLFERGLFDIEHRPGKQRGAFCTYVADHRAPFVFANFTGSRRDVGTLMHEMGHAFQTWQSRDKVAVDYLMPTLEAAEIHSMSLEFLSWPEMERFFGDAAAVYRREHLLDAILFLPYGVAVDHFQHLVYAHPAASPRERHEMWQEMERRYLPWRTYGDLAHPARGGLWQEKQHIYLAPFYYIDYTLAQCCALQFWLRAKTDRDEAIDDYVTLCGRGGEAPFKELVRSAGLQSPFAPGALSGVVAAARSELLPR